MKKILFMFFSILLIAGCSAIKQRSIANDLVDMSDRVKLLCSAASIFDAVGANVPGADQCAKAIKTMNSDQYEALYDVGNCVRRFDADTTEFRRCLSSVPNWEEIADKISK